MIFCYSTVKYIPTFKNFTKQSESILSKRPIYNATKHVWVKKSTQKCNINQLILKWEKLYIHWQYLDSALQINLTSFLFLSFDILSDKGMSTIIRKGGQNTAYFSNYLSLRLTFFVYLNTRNILQQTECQRKYKNPAICTISGIKEICKNVKHCDISTNLFFF